jgi:hypothetical protein
MLALATCCSTLDRLGDIADPFRRLLRCDFIYWIFVLTLILNFVRSPSPCGAGGCAPCPHVRCAPAAWRPAGREFCGGCRRPLAADARTPSGGSGPSCSAIWPDRGARDTLIPRAADLISA